MKSIILVVNFLSLFVSCWVILHTYNNCNFYFSHFVGFVHKFSILKCVFILDYMLNSCHRLLYIQWLYLKSKILFINMFACIHFFIFLHFFSYSPPNGMCVCSLLHIRQLRCRRLQPRISGPDCSRT